MSIGVRVRVRVRVSVNPFGEFKIGAFGGVIRSSLRMDSSSGVRRLFLYWTLDEKFFLVFFVFGRFGSGDGLRVEWFEPGFGWRVSFLEAVVKELRISGFFWGEVL